MAARALWKGRLVVGKLHAAVNMFSAVQDRKVHFHLLHAKDLTPVQQRIVRKSDGNEVPKAEQLKAFPLSKDTGVIVTAEEMEKIQPAASRDIDVMRFVPRLLVGDEWYDRPYYLGPDKDDKSYFAIVDALARKDLVAIARWVMRKQPYLGALTAIDGHLMMITMRRAEQVLSVSRLDIPAAKKPDPKEIELAKQLVESISGDFEPELWKDEYRERLNELIKAKAQGKKIKLVTSKPKRATGDLTEALRQSLKGTKERKVA
jgi:DNA end-binding protein Ku